MDNRSYDPDKLPDEHLEPGSSAEEISRVLGEHHEQPVPVDPISGISADPSATDQMAPRGSWDVERQGYPEYVDKAIDNQIPHSSNQPTGPPPPATGAHPPAGGQYGRFPSTPDAYAPGPGSPAIPPPAVEDRPRGFNWLACCGIGCGVLLVLGIVAMFLGVKYFKPLINAGLHVANVSEEVRNDGAPDVAEVVVTPEELSADPTRYTNQWVQVTGVVSDDPSTMVDAFKQQRGMQETAGYLIDPNIVILDVSGSQVKAKLGDTITVIGKAVFLDFGLLGPLATEEIKKDNELGDTKQLVFLITDDVQAGPADDGEPEPSFP